MCKLKIEEITNSIKEGVTDTFMLNIIDDYVNKFNIMDEFKNLFDITSITKYIIDEYDGKGYMRKIKPRLNMFWVDDIHHVGCDNIDGIENYTADTVFYLNTVLLSSSLNSIVKDIGIDKVFKHIIKISLDINIGVDISEISKYSSIYLTFDFGIGDGNEFIFNLEQLSDDIKNKLFEGEMPVSYAIQEYDGIVYAGTFNMDTDYEIFELVTNKYYAGKFINRCLELENIKYTRVESINNKNRYVVSLTDSKYCFIISLSNIKDPILLNTLMTKNDTNNDYITKVDELYTTIRNDVKYIESIDSISIVFDNVYGLPETMGDSFEMFTVYVKMVNGEAISVKPTKKSMPYIIELINTAIENFKDKWKFSIVTNKVSINLDNEMAATWYINKIRNIYNNTEFIAEI